jgi:hypothetical protein
MSLAGGSANNFVTLCKVTRNICESGMEGGRQCDVFANERQLKSDTAKIELERPSIVGCKCVYILHHECTALQERYHPH